MILGDGGGGPGASAMTPGHPGAVDMRVGDVRAWGSAERRGRRPRGAIGRRPYRGPYAREKTDAGGGCRRKDARAGVVLVAQVHAGMEAGTGGADQGEFAWGTPVRGAGPKLP